MLFNAIRENFRINSIQQRILQISVRTSLEEQLDPMGSLLVPVFLRKHIATCDFFRGGGGDLGGGSDPLHLSGYAHVFLSSGCLQVKCPF